MWSLLSTVAVSKGLPDDSSVYSALQLAAVMHRHPSAPLDGSWACAAEVSKAAVMAKRGSTKTIFEPLSGASAVWRGATRRGKLLLARKLSSFPAALFVAENGSMDALGCTACPP